MENPSEQEVFDKLVNFFRLRVGGYTQLEVVLDTLWEEVRRQMPVSDVQKLEIDNLGMVNLNAGDVLRRAFASVSIPDAQAFMDEWYQVHVVQADYQGRDQRQSLRARLADAIAESMLEFKNLAHPQAAMLHYQVSVLHTFVLFRLPVGEEGAPNVRKVAGYDGVHIFEQNGDTLHTLAKPRKYASAADVEDHRNAVTTYYRQRKLRALLAP